MAVKSVALVAVLALSSISPAGADELVSMFSVLGNPSAFNEKKIVVEGVLGVEDDLIVLYPDIGSYDARIYINSFLISKTPDVELGGLSRVEIRRMAGKYVAIWCKYFYSDPRSRAYTGALGEITKIALVPKIVSFSSGISPQ